MSGAAIIVRLLLVRGRVQGVGYRGWAEGEARRRDLEGWVRNRIGGAVEILVAGSPDRVEGFIAACRRGPFRARVDDLAVDPASARHLEQRRPGEAFSILSTI
ncbi:acylphosphatase [Rhodoplanes roseus]|uniref:acylphosphatase n=1 Tax=Rhodoplanes roseus TaxID=29409 RepID=A0A327KVQ0_9BRAD|nr:acylphosphatase [Rhodoplanes roseus]RAI39428.1 acylphosphatase [Rhodoplanes roseus]